MTFERLLCERGDARVEVQLTSPWDMCCGIYKSCPACMLYSDDPPPPPPAECSGHFPVQVWLWKSTAAFFICARQCMSRPNFLDICRVSCLKTDFDMWTCHFVQILMFPNTENPMWDPSEDYSVLNAPHYKVWWFLHFSSCTIIRPMFECPDQYKAHWSCFWSKYLLSFVWPQK